eukprot:scaffold95921_cov58-Phaeocystis_antarctica.AAC.2
MIPLRILGARSFPAVSITPRRVLHFDAPLIAYVQAWDVQLTLSTERNSKACAQSSLLRWDEAADARCAPRVSSARCLPPR